METLKITFIQPNIIWEQPAANINHYNKLIEEVGETHLIVLPEMFSTGFSMQPRSLAETMSGETVYWMKKMASQKKAAIAGTLIIEEEGKYYNRCVWVNPDGTTSYYNKRHLFTMGGEMEHYTPGHSRLIVEYLGWRFCPLICYDLRFPVWSRNTVNYDVLLYLSNWPSPRHHVWKNLLVARAVENQAYCIGVNRVGSDGNGVNYMGDSALIDPKGFAAYLGHSEKVETLNISFSDLKRFRKAFPVLNDRDAFNLVNGDDVEGYPQ